MNQLRNFFNKNSTYREHFLKHKLFFDGQLEFAKLGRRLLIYEPEYDQDGFDLIFDDLLCHKHFQVKSILKPAKTSSWKIHRSLLRPHILELDTHPASPDSFGVGYGGGVLLIHAFIDSDENITTSYSFTDSLIISSFYLGILKYKDDRRNKSAKNCGAQLFNPHKIGEKIEITQSCFLHFFCLADIFAYCGFKLSLESSGIRYRLNKAVARHCGRAQKVDQKISPDKWKELVYQDFLDIVDCSKLQNPKNS